MVVTVKNLHGFVEVGDDGGWICTRKNGSRERHPDPVISSSVSVLLSLVVELGGSALTSPMKFAYICW